MDASSDFQDSLPLSSDALLGQLDAWGLGYRLFRHAPLRTVEEAKSAEADMQLAGGGGLRVKNLYLRDKKKRNYLITLEQDREVDLKALGARLGAGSLSFGSPARLMQYLGVRPGAVSPLAMINGARGGVRFCLDGRARDAGWIFVHPLVNDRTVAMRMEDLLAFLDRVGAGVDWLD